jgi:ketosteroid isomerase-like protein
VAAARHPALAFNDAITARDIAALGDLMSDDHTFIDSAGRVTCGREDALEAWRGFFEAFPDYRNVWTTVTTRGERLTAIGQSVCAVDPRLDGPALWTARARAGKVLEWRVYEDTPDTRALLGL